MAKHEQWFKQLQPKYQAMLRSLESKGFAAIRCIPYQESVEIKGQKLKLPFSNSFHIVLLQKIKEYWHLVTGWCEGDHTPFKLKAVWDFLEDGTVPENDRMFSYTVIDVASGEENIKTKVDVYGEGKIWAPPTAACRMVIAIQPRMQNAWCEIARIYPH